MLILTKIHLDRYHDLYFSDYRTEAQENDITKGPSANNAWTTCVTKLGTETWLPSPWDSLPRYSPWKYNQSQSFCGFTQEGIYFFALNLKSTVFGELKTLEKACWSMSKTNLLNSLTMSWEVTQYWSLLQVLAGKSNRAHCCSSKTLSSLFPDSNLSNKSSMLLKFYFHTK